MINKVQITNDFHDTETTIRGASNGSNTIRFSAAQVKRAKKTLCGVDGCTCSDDLGIRGRQHGMEFDFHPDGSATVWIPTEE